MFCIAIGEFLCIRLYKSPKNLTDVIIIILSLLLVCQVHFQS